MTSMTNADKALFEEHLTEAGKDAPPRHLGSRFDAAGNFLPQPGNTVVRQVVPGSKTEAALVKLRAALMALPFGDRFAYTPVESYHMTVFEGVMDDRRKPDLWPAKVSYEATIEDTTELFLERLKGLPQLPSFDMKVERVTPLGLTLTGATPDDEKIARKIRDQLTRPFGHRSPTHDAYRFHVTLAYVKAWLPAGAADIYLPELARLTEWFAAEIAVLELAPPALCTFQDMNWFEPVLFLG
jgi:hypothetical protein